MSEHTREERTMESVRQQVRNDAALDKRLTFCENRISAMCSEHRGPHMTIPVQWDDDDIYITTTLQDAREYLERLERAVWYVMQAVHFPEQLPGWNPSWAVAMRFFKAGQWTPAAHEFAARMREKERNDGR